MTDIREISHDKYNLALAEAIKKMPEFKKPEWVAYVKTSTAKVRPNIDEDFWYKRAASILRQIYIKGTVGVQRLRTRYGGRKDMGMAPPRFVKGGGKIIRTILQQADAAGLTEKSISKKAGRKLTIKGRDFLESIK
jgi:small subunit ribosomal protein S19e